MLVNSSYLILPLGKMGKVMMTGENPPGMTVGDENESLWKTAVPQHCSVWLCFVFEILVGFKVLHLRNRNTESPSFIPLEGSRDEDGVA